MAHAHNIATPTDMVSPRTHHEHAHGQVLPSTLKMVDAFSREDCALLWSSSVVGVSVHVGVRMRFVLVGLLAMGIFCSGSSPLLEVGD